MSKYEWDNHKDTNFSEFERFFRDSNIQPIYDSRSDYTTNAPSFYEYLSRHNHLIKILAKRIYDYDKELAKRFEEWDKRIENLPKELEDLLIEWLSDGTLEEIINVNIFNSKADKTDLDLLSENLDLLSQNVNEYGYNIVKHGVKEGIQHAEENTTIIQNLLDNYNHIYIPPGKFHFQGDIITPENVTIYGSGYLSEVIINDGGLKLPDGEKFTLKDFRLKRTGEKGAALEVYADGYGWRRFLISNVHVLGSTETGIKIKEGWIGTIINPVVQECEIGIEILKGTIYGASANNLNIYGGELQGNRIGLKANGVKGMNLFGTCIEGNEKYGVHFQGTMRDVVFYGTYFEANGFEEGGKEVFLDTAYPDGSPYNIRFDGGGFLRGGAGTNDVFDIRGGKNIVISDGVSFYGYQNSDEPIIKVSENYPNHTTGYVGAVLGNFKKLMTNDTMSYGRERVMSYGLNTEFKPNVNTKSSFRVLPMQNPTKNITFEYTIYSEQEGTFSLSESWYKTDGSLIRSNIDGVTVDVGFNTFKRSITLNGYSDFLNVVIARNGTSLSDTLEGSVTFSQVDVYVIDNPQKL